VTLARRAAAELVGTAFLLAAVVGSGIMAERLAGGNDAIALLANSLATGGALLALIHAFGPVSGAHFNPAVSALFAARGELSWSDALSYGVVQVVGATLGVLAAHLMFELPLVQFATKARPGIAQAWAEFVATFGLLTVIVCVARSRPKAVALSVAAYITGAYWFTASTSFANPAVTMAREFTNTFTGIAPADAVGFLAAQVAATVVAIPFFSWMFRT